MSCDSLCANDLGNFLYHFDFVIALVSMISSGFFEEIVICYRAPSCPKISEI